MPINTPAERVAAEVRAEMARQRRTQEHLAQLLGKSQAAVSRRLLGQVPFDVNELAAVAEFLGKSSSDFLRELALSP